MKITRYKKAHKYMSFFCNNYGFRQPYQILIDGTICFAALKNKVNLRDQLPKYFEGDVKLLTTQCVVLEMEKLGRPVFGATLIAKQFGVHRCGHNTEPAGGSECLLTMLGAKNSNRYIIASQDRELQAKARSIPGTPILYLHHQSPTLEPPSQTSTRMATLNSKAVFDVSKHQEGVIKELKKRTLGLEDKVSMNIKRKRKIRGPNPLSCKKKKRKAGDRTTNKVETEGKCKRKRKRVKVPKHLKEHWVALAEQEHRGKATDS